MTYLQYICTSIQHGEYTVAQKKAVICYKMASMALRSYDYHSKLQTKSTLAKKRHISFLVDSKEQLIQNAISMRYELLVLITASNLSSIAIYVNTLQSHRVCYTN